MADERRNFRIDGYVYSSISSLVLPGYGPYNGSDGATDEATAFEIAFGPNGIGKETDGLLNPIGLKFMIRYFDSNSLLHCDEYIYLGGTIENNKSITNPRYIKLNRQLKSETALDKAAGAVNTTSTQVYPVVTDSLGNLAVVVPWTNTTYTAATTSAEGLMSAADKNKLNGIAAGAQVNQNAFSNIKVGDVTIEADAKTDTLELVAGDNVVVTPDSSTDKVTIAAKLPADFIEVVEDGLYNIDTNYTVEPTGAFVIGGGSSSTPDLTSLTARVAALEAVLGNTSDSSITFNLEQE